MKIEFNNGVGMCPTQWDGKVSDGRFAYARYRWGNLTLAVSEKEETIYDETPILTHCTNSGYDGEMSDEELQEILSLNGISATFQA